MNIGWLRNKKILLLLTIVALIILLLSVLPLNDWLLSVKDWLITLGPWATPMFIAIYILATIVGLPSAILILAAGTLFGLIRGIVCVSVADTLGASACFLLGRTVARKQIKTWIVKNPRYAELDRALARKGWKILFLTRLSPIVPSNVLNYGFSLTKVKFWHYFFFSWLGMLPVILLYVYIGSFGAALAGRESTSGQLALQIGGLLATVGATVYTTRLVKNALSQDD